MRMKIGVSDVQLNHGGTEWKLQQLLYVDDAVLLAESEEELYRMIGCSDEVCRRGILNENLSKSKIPVF